ncbi:hypothetical protein BD560DRAFT_403253 [Blakeslea trispora]|nr:hypothetical protein BD560DRAFT_403253 [Blakeslea trispora]
MTISRANLFHSKEAILFFFASRSIIDFLYGYFFFSFTFFKMNTNDSTRAIELSIKLIEQPTKSVLLPQNATVLELKNKIQSLYDIDSLRQRLIFQGKVLKDDKNLLDYENLGDGKVIHLVTRPISSSSSGSRRSVFHRTTPTRRPQILREEDGLTAEYTVLTLNATTTRLPRLRDMRSDLLDRLVPSVSLRNNPLSPPSRSLFSSRPSILQTLTSHPPSMPPFEFLRTWLTSERRNDQHEDVLSFPIPSSLDMRLSRTLAYIIEIKSLLNSSMNTPNEHPMLHLPRPTPFPAIQEARRLLSRQPNISAKTEFIVSEMTDIYDTLVPFLQSIAAHLGSSYSLIVSNISCFVSNEFQESFSF